MRRLTTALFCVSVLSILASAGCQQPQQPFAAGSGYADPYAGQGNAPYNAGSASRTAQPVQQGSGSRAPTYQSGGSGSR